MEYATRRLAEAINGLPERLKLYTTAHYYEQIPDGELAEQLGLTSEEVESLASEAAAALRPYLVCTTSQAREAEVAAVAALRERLEEVTGERIDKDGRLTDLADATVLSIPADALKLALEDVEAGDGNELRFDTKRGRQPKFHSARSSCALAVNAFAPWRAEPDGLQILGRSGFSELRFEEKFPIQGVTGHFAPNLDVVGRCASLDSVVAVESKFIEYFSPAGAADISTDYNNAIEALAHPSWKEQVDRLRDSPTEFGYFGAVQIIKHYLGLKSCFSNTPVDLIYLYWEPLDRDQHPLFQQHAAEVESFGSDLRDPHVVFIAHTYADAFQDWDASADPRVSAHLEQLRLRYELKIFS